MLKHHKTVQTIKFKAEGPDEYRKYTSTYVGILYSYLQFVRNIKLLILHVF